MKGILDPEGKNINPLNNKKYSDNYKKFSLTGDNPIGAIPWTEFPVYKKRKEIIKTIEDNNVILVVSGTGSGKSVLVPKFALHTLDYNSKVILTNPKTLATKKNAEYAAMCLDVELGKEVGYQYRGADSNSHSKETKLLFSTDGSIVAKMINNDPLLSEYNIIIIDEAHERGVQIDVLLLLLKRAVQQRTDLKVIIMSATINKDIFINYFNIDNIKFKEIDVGSVPNFPIKEYFLNEPIKNITDETVKRIINILNNTDKGEILAFITGKLEGERICSLLKTKKELILNEKPFCIVLASGISNQDQKLATDEFLYKSDKNNVNTRKIVMATNIAESSVTVKGIVYVIENGYANEEKYNPINNTRELNKTRISKAQARQRRGRAGRTQAGVCYNLYTKQQYDNFNDYPTPDIRKTDLTEDILRFLSLKEIQTIDKLNNLLNDLIEPPKEIQITSAINNLKSINVINKENRLSKTGYIISKFRKINPYSAFSIIKSIKYDVLEEVSIIAAMIEISDNRMDKFFNNIKFNKNNNDLKNKVTNIHKKFYSSNGDLISFLKLYKAFYDVNADENKNIDEWCKENYVNCKNLKKVKDMYKVIIRDSEKTSDHIEIVNSKDKKEITDNIEKIIYCLYQGYNSKIIEHVSQNIYRNKFPKKVTITKIHRNSSLNILKSYPKKGFYIENSLVLNNNSFNLATKIS